MTDYDWIQCPECKLTNRTSKLEQLESGGTCPACSAEVLVE